MFPNEEIYGLVSQLRRASVSISSNIAEGSKRSKKEFAHFVKIAQGSGAEVENQLIISERLHFLSTQDSVRLLAQLDSIMKMLSRLYASMSN